MSARLDLQEALLSQLHAEMLSAAADIDATAAGAHAMLLMQERTRRGEFLEGSSPGAGSYSTRPFARPAGGLSREILGRLDDTADGSSFFTRAGALWVVVERGYAWLREAAGYQADHVDLNWSGKMLAGMRVRSRFAGGKLITEAGYIEGMSPADAVRLAGYHDRTGAGPRRTIRRFIGLTEDEIAQVVEKFVEAVARRFPQ